MKKSVTAGFTVVIFFIAIACSAKTIKITMKNQPLIFNYITVTAKTTSMREGNMITPSYEYIISKKTAGTITHFKFDILYTYGQTRDYKKSETFDLNTGDTELEELNKTGQLVIKRSYEPIEREPNAERQDQFTYTDPDGEILEGTAYELTILAQ